MFTGHGGDVAAVCEKYGIEPDRLCDFSANINPLGPPPQVRPAVMEAMETIAQYPDPGCRELRRALAGHFDVAAEDVLPGAGATEILYLLARALRPKRVCVLAPCYMDYWVASSAVGAEVDGLVASDEAGFRHDLPSLVERMEGSDMVFLGNPNNPTGQQIDKAALLAAARGCPSVRFVVDEAFNEFLDDPAACSMIGPDRPANLVVVRSLTKFFGIPGLRLGFAVADADVVRELERAKEPWTVNVLALRAGEVVYDDADYAQRTRALIAEQRPRLHEALAATSGLAPVPSAANFILVRITRQSVSASELKRRMIREGFLIRDCTNVRGLDSRYVRVAVRNAEENAGLVEAFARALSAEK